MLSKMAIEDIEDLEGAGCNLSPSEIIRLNALGLKVERASNAGDILAAPRIGWAGDVPIYEPTIQSEQWIDIYAQRWWGDNGDAITSALLFACAHARFKGFFARPEMLTPESVCEEMRKWHQSLTCTEAQLQHALAFALFGNDANSREYPEPRETEETEDAEEDETSTEDIREYAINEAIAAGLGLSIEDIKGLTQSRLYSILRAYHRNQGIDSKASNLSAHADYFRTLIAIKKAHGIKD